MTPNITIATPTTQEMPLLQMPFLFPRTTITKVFKPPDHLSVTDGCNNFDNSVYLSWHFTDLIHQKQTNRLQTRQLTCSRDRILQHLNSSSRNCRNPHKTLEQITPHEAPLKDYTDRWMKVSGCKISRPSSWRSWSTRSEKGTQWSSL